MLLRSRINRAVAEARRVIDHFGYTLPTFASWTPEEWEAAGPEGDEIRDCMLGWDVTDFGSGRFDEIGRTLFTLRNGKHGDPRYPKTYAEKLLIDPEGQRAPMHFHKSKREDIINRGGGNILVKLIKATEDNQLSDEPVAVQVDGITRVIGAGEIIRLEPGMSLCIVPRTFHQFWAEEGTGWRLNGVGYTLSSEVSSVCDDRGDNFFLEAMVRFPSIDEDEQRLVHLCQEYPNARSEAYAS